jgi:sigma-70-like protein
MPSRRRSSGHGAACRGCAIRRPSITGCTAWWPTPAFDLGRKRRRRVIEVELTPIHDSPTLDGAAVIADRDQLDRALARLEPEARAVVVLHFYLDLPLPRVADMLGIPIGTAKSRLHRSLGAMRSALAIDEVASAQQRPLGGPAT